MRTNLCVRFTNVLICTSVLACDGDRSGEVDNQGGGGSQSERELFEELSDTRLDQQLDKIPFSKERVLTGPGTYKYDLSQLVGHALYLEKDAQGRCQSHAAAGYDPLLLSAESYVKPETKLDMQAINAEIFDRKVSRGTAAELSVMGIGPSINDSNVAHLTIVETAFLNYPDGALVDNWRVKLDSVIRLTECPALLVRGATVRVVTAKFFERFEPKLELDNVPIAGAVFKANGRMFRETQGSQTETLVSMTAYLVRAAGQQPAVEEVVHAPERRRDSIAGRSPRAMRVDTTLFPRLLRVPDSGAMRTTAKRVDLRNLLNRRRLVLP